MGREWIDGLNKLVEWEEWINNCGVGWNVDYDLFGVLNLKYFYLYI